MRKIVLIEPQNGQDHVYSLISMPRLGLPLFGAQLKEAGYHVDLYMAKASELPWAKIIQADLVGLSLTTSTSREGYRMADYLRSKDVPVVIGGIHATFQPDEALLHADYVVRGEADFTFLQLIQTLIKGKKPYDIPGVSFRDEKGAVVHNNPLGEWVDVNKLPIPDLSLFRMGKPRVIPVMTSRGCPYHCTFCSVTPMFGRQYRFRHTESVLRELAQYKDRSIFFCDDNFTANTKRSKELLQAIMDYKIGLKRWGAQVRVESARDDELLQLMQQSGGNIVYVGLESINPATLEAYNKKQNIDDIRECVRRFHDYRIKVHGMFVLGSDEDTIKTIRDTVDFALESRIDTTQFLTLTPLPGTPTYTKLESEGRLLTKNWEFYDGHHVVFQPAKMTPEELQKETKNAFSRFYALRHIFGNAGLTGWNSAIYRGMGWYLSGRFSKHSRWYEQALQYLQKENDKYVSAFSGRMKTVNNGGILELKAGDKPLRIHVLENKGVLYLKLQGFISRLTLKELKRTWLGLVPRYCLQLVVNAEELHFTSDKAAKAFARQLNAINKRVHRLQLVYRTEEEDLAFIKKYVLKKPGLELSSDNR